MRIKEEPGDFIVNEIAEHDVKNNGKYAIIRLEKRNMNTLEALDKVARRLGVGMKRFGFAGTKDKRAVTRQYISGFGIKEGDLKRVEIKGIKVEFIGYKDEPISLGDLDGNEFRIVVRELDEDEVRKVKERKEFIFKNYYGEQRFGRNNRLVGKAIVKRDFKKACELIKEQESKYLRSVEGNDYVGAIKRVPLKLRKLYVHAYQSHLWNKMIDMVDVEEVPLLGFGTEFKDEGVKKAYETLMKEEEVSFRDFIIRKMPELSVEGEIRKTRVEAGDFSLEEKENYVVLRFKLPKGSYATTVIRQIFE